MHTQLLFIGTTELLLVGGLALLLFGGEQNGFGPFEVVDVEMSDGIMILVGNS